jgi:hypothetical protein
MRIRMNIRLHRQKRSRAFAGQQKASGATWRFSTVNIPPRHRLAQRSGQRHAQERPASPSKSPSRIRRRRSGSRVAKPLARRTFPTRNRRPQCAFGMPLVNELVIGLPIWTSST